MTETGVTMADLADIKTDSEVQAEAQERLRQLTGEDQRVRVLGLQQKALRDNGFLVDIDVTGVSMFYAKVDWRLDLGIPKNDERQRSGRISPGRKWLIDVRKFKSLETRIRKNLEKHSFKITAFGGYRYVPDTAFTEWYNDHTNICNEWERQKDELLASYDTHLYGLEIDFSKMARETWLTLVGRATTDAGAGEFLDRYNRSVSDFIQAVVDAALKSVPSRQRIRDELHIHLRPMATFMLSSEQAAMEYETAKINAAKQQEWDSLNYWRRKEKAQAEAAEAEAATVVEAERDKQLLSYTQRNEAQRAARAKTDAEIERARITTEAIRKEKTRIAREALADMAAPIEEIVNDLRGQILTTAGEITRNINRHGRVLGKTVQKVEGMVATFRLLNIAGDEELEQVLNSLESAMEVAGTNGTKRDVGSIEQALRSVNDVASTVAGEVIDETADADWDYLEL